MEDKRFGVVFMTLIVAASSSVIHKNVFIPCSLDDDNFVKCFIDTLQSPEVLKKGIPQFKIPPLEPFVVEKVSVNQTINDLVSIQATITNNIVRGFGNNFKIDEVTTNSQENFVELRYRHESIDWEFDYDVRGHLIVVPLYSKGHCSAKINNMKTFIRAYYDKITKKGIEYYQVKELNYVYRIADARVKMTADDPQMQYAADIIERFYNENNKLVMDAILPIASSSVGEFLKEFLNDVLLNIPISALH